MNICDMLRTCQSDSSLGKASAWQVGGPGFKPQLRQTFFRHYYICQTVFFMTFIRHLVAKL